MVCGSPVNYENIVIACLDTEENNLIIYLLKQELLSL